MWRDYLSSYRKYNRSASLSITIAAFISALLLSLLCGLFYNMWKYEVERIQQEEGGWHSRIIGELDAADIEWIRNFASVKEVTVNEAEKNGEDSFTDIYFKDMRSVFSDMPQIADQVGAAFGQVVYHYSLLSMYGMRDSGDAAPRLVFPMFFLVTVMASFSLIVIIQNAFAVSMSARIHQFGILSSIGATPKQIRSCLLQEAAVLSAVPVLAGNLLGIAGSMGLLQMVNVLLGDGIAGRHKAVFGYHPLVLAVTLLVTILTVGACAWLPARKLSRITPLKAIKNTGELQLKRRKNSYALTLLFGVEGELAGNALKAQRKALRTASLSLLVSFLAFTIMQCFFCLSGISTRETYFERYQGAWDIMVTVKDTGADVFEDAEAVRKLTGVKSAVVYQKAAAKTILTEGQISKEMQSMGGFSHASRDSAVQTDDGWLVNAPLIILDDHSFMAYCEQIGILPRLDGAVIRNQIRDVTNPDFRHPDEMPYVTEASTVRVLKRSEKGSDSNGHTKVSGSSTGLEETEAEISVLAYTKEVPLLREEYAALDHYELVHFLPVSLWREIKERIGGEEADSYIRILGEETAASKDLTALQDAVVRLIGSKYSIESENRIEEYETSQKQIRGMMAILGGFCILLAMIGVGSVYSNTLGFVLQRKREFARYLSVGLTPKELRKMFCIEALVLAGRPIWIGVPFAIIAVGYMLHKSYVNVGEFLAQAPLIPILLFVLAVFGFVAPAYVMAWRKVRNISLSEVLKDDTMI